MQNERQGCENVRQHQQWRCKEIFNNRCLQEICHYLAGIISDITENLISKSPHNDYYNFLWSEIQLKHDKCFQVANFLIQYVHFPRRI